MKYLSFVVIAVLLFVWFSVASAADAFHDQNLVVLQIGDGVEVGKNDYVPVVLKEFTADGKAVQAISLPVAAAGANYAFTHKRNRVGGGLTRSADGRYLVCGGVDLAPRSTGPSAPSPARVIARVDADGKVDTSTRFSDAYRSIGEIGIRSVVSADGSGYWLAGKGNEDQGVRYVKHGGTTSTAITDSAEESRHLAIVNGQLFATPVASVGTVGAGLPEPNSSQEVTTLFPGVPMSAWNSPALFDLDPSVDGLDTLYVVEDRKANFAKFKFDGKVWKRDNNFVIKDAPAMLFITGKIENGRVILFGTTDSGSSGAFANELVEIRDVESSPQLRVLAKADPNYSFRGVSFAPVSKR